MEVRDRVNNIKCITLQEVYTVLWISKGSKEDTPFLPFPMDSCSIIVLFHWEKEDWRTYI